jgi:hypothetical protein
MDRSWRKLWGLIMVVIFELINGIQFGLEHITGEDDDPYTGAVVLNLSIFRFVFMNMKEE